MRVSGAVALLCVVGVSLSASPAGRWQTYRGAWFTVRYPAGFIVRPSLKSHTSDQGYDSAFFRAPDRTVEFYVFSPQWNGEPADIVVKPATERVVDRKEVVRPEKTSGPIHTRWVTIAARDGAYERSYLDVEEKGANTRHTFGYRYRDRRAYKAHLAEYKTFKESLEQFAD